MDSDNRRRTSVLASLLLAAALRPTLAQARLEANERYRIRIVNRKGGAIELSANRGQTWQPLGHVLRPANAAAPSSSVLPAASSDLLVAVAAVAPSHLLIRLPAGKGRPKSLRLLSMGSTGEPADGTAIATDIPTRGSLFRCVAPPIGSRVLLERGPKPAPLPVDYTPHAGDMLLILVSGPAGEEPPTITIDNRVGGEVVLNTPGSAPQVLARVKQPLRGVGRYTGTERAGSGSVVSCSPTAVLVSTSGTLRRQGPDGRPQEERGGFVIQPAVPELTGATHPASQLLLEAVPEGGSRPALSRFFTLPVPVSSGDPLDPTPTRVEVRIDGGSWEPFPELRGSVGEENMARALQEALGGKRPVKAGITQLRLIYGTATEAALRRRFRLAATPAVDRIQRGTVTITANVTGEGIAFVSFYLDGQRVQLTNLPPYTWIWDTREAGNGEHLLEIRGMDSKLAVISSVTTKVIVDN